MMPAMTQMQTQTQFQPVNKTGRYARARKSATGEGGEGVCIVCEDELATRLDWRLAN